MNVVLGFTDIGLRTFRLRFPLKRMQADYVQDSRAQNLIRANSKANIKFYSLRALRPATAIIHF